MTMNHELGIDLDDRAAVRAWIGIGLSESMAVSLRALYDIRILRGESPAEAARIALEALVHGER